MGLALLIRHARSVANVDGILAGRVPGVGLHASGRDQATALAAAFHGISCDTIHVSPLQRTRETADIVFGGRPMVQADELLECDYGTWSGRPIAELARDPLWDLLHREPSATTFPGGESIPQVHARMTAFLRRKAALPGLHAFVTHADPIMMAIGHAAGAPLDSYQRIDVEPASLSVLLVDGDAWGVVAVNVPPSGAAATLESLVRWQRDSVSDGGTDAAHHPPV